MPPPLVPSKAVLCQASKASAEEIELPPPLVPSKAVLCQASKASAEEIELPPTTALYANFLDL